MVNCAKLLATLAAPLIYSLST